MNKSNVKTFLYTILICLIIFGVMKFLFVALPYIIIAGVVTWLSFKVYNFFKSKKGNSTNNSKNEPKISDVEVNKDSVDTSKAIDVDFKDVE